MELKKIKIGKREFSLAFTLGAMEELESALPEFRLDKLEQYVKSASGIQDIILALARQGELLSGRVLDIDRAWLGAHLSPSPKKMAPIQVAVMEALADGLTMEAEQDEDQEVDVVLDEIKKNDQTGI